MEKKRLIIAAILLVLLLSILRVNRPDTTDTIDNTAQAAVIEQVQQDTKEAADLKLTEAEENEIVKNLHKEYEIYEPEYIPSTSAPDGYISELRIMEITSEVGNLYNICPELLQAICFHESSYYITARNGTCVGLMQVNSTYMAERMERLEVTDIYDEYSNVLLAADLIAELRDTTENGQDIYYVLMRYNMATDTANKLYSEGTISQYALDVAETAQELERLHGK